MKITSELYELSVLRATDNLFLYVDIHAGAGDTTVCKGDIVLCLGAISNYDALYFFKGIVHRDLLSLKVQTNFFEELVG